MSPTLSSRKQTGRLIIREGREDMKSETVVAMRGSRWPHISVCTRRKEALVEYQYEKSQNGDVENLTEK